MADEIRPEKVSEHLQRMFLGCLLFRLGGEQVFTAEEIDMIKAEVAGVQFFATEDNKIILRVRNREFVQEHSEPGKGLII